METQYDSSYCVPVIDLARSDRELVPALRSACADVGFFYLVGHGVSAQDFATLYADMRRFFALDLETKRLVCTTTNAHNRGWTPLGEETLDPARQSCGDTKEGYYIGRDIGSDHKLAHLPLHGPNVWLPPNVLPGWRENMERYAAHTSTFTPTSCLGSNVCYM